METLGRRLDRLEGSKQGARYYIAHYEAGDPGAGVDLEGPRGMVHYDSEEAALAAAHGAPVFFMPQNHRDGG